MLLPKQFDVPTKFLFVSPSGSNVGSVFVDRVVQDAGDTSFYFGQSCVAILSDSYLLIGARRLERAALGREKPFRYDLNEGQRAPHLPSEFAQKIAMRRTASLCG